MDTPFKVWVLIIAVIFGAGGLAAFLFPKSKKASLTRFSLFCSFAGGVVTVLGVICFSAANSIPQKLQLAWPGMSGILGPAEAFTYVNFALDPLSGFFILLAGVFTAIISIYSIAWLRNEDECDRIVSVFNLFVLCTLFSLLADQVFFYLFFLEGITLTFSYLLLYRHNKNLGEGGASEGVDAGRLAFKSYLIFNHIGIILLTVGLLVIAAGYQSFNFEDFRKIAAQIPQVKSLMTPASANFAFCLAFFGLVFKGGIFPAYVWVPIVHPQSPTNIHAMLSGIILKVSGIYGMLRVFFQFFNPDQQQLWWGLLVLSLAGLTTLVGVFYALFAEDLKTALASHSVENLGIILFGIGLALCFSQQKLPALAAIALAASLYHLLNHSIFKALLFLCTGAIENRTGLTRLSDLGGILRLYPWTGTAFLIGSFSIAGYPPFNGFVSEWLILQSLFATRNLFTIKGFPPLAALVILLAGICLVCAFALTALAFSKIAGEVVMGAPRRPDLFSTFKRGDVPWHMRSILLVLALACLLFGILPGFIRGGLDRLILAVQPSFYLTVTLPAQQSVDLFPQFPQNLVLTLFILIAVAFVVTFFWRFYTRGPVWNGGASWDPARMQFTSVAFTSLIWSSMALMRKDEGSDSSKRPPLPFLLPLTGDHAMIEIVRQLINRLLVAMLKFSQWFGDGFQNGDVRRYILYIFCTLIFMLLLFLLLPQPGAQ